MKNTQSFLYALTHKFCCYSAVLCISFLACMTIANAQPASFAKGVYVSITAEPNFKLYGNTSVSTLDCIDSLCKLSYIDGICFKILWKDLKVDSSNGILSITLYKENLSQLMEAAVSQHKAVALALYAGAFTPPSLINSMPANHVLSNIHLAAQSPGPCHIDTFVTANNINGTFNIPVPWDSLYQVNFRNMMRILNNYLVQNDISLSYTIFTGINEYSGETRLPNDIIQTRDASGNINLFQNDYILWKNAGFAGYTVDPKINQARSTFDLFLKSIYNKYPAFRRSVLCVQSMGATTEFPQVPTRLPNTTYDNPKSISYYACSTNYDSTSDVFYDMLRDAMNSNRSPNSVATMYCSMNEVYGSGQDYAGIINNDVINNTGLCSSFKAYHLRDVEFLGSSTSPPPASVDQLFVNNFIQSLTNGVEAGAQFIEVFPYDVLAAQQAANKTYGNELRQALRLAHEQLITLSPDYNGIPANVSISDTLGKKDSLMFSIASLPAVNSYTWFLDGVSRRSGSGLLKFGLLKGLVAHGAHTISVNYSTHCGTNSASLFYLNGILSPAAMSTEVASAPDDFTVRQVSPRNFTILFTSPVENAHICVFSIAGQQILSTLQSGSQFNFTLYSAPAGLYLVKVLAPEDQINGAVKISITQ